MKVYSGFLSAQNIVTLPRLTAPGDKPGELQSIKIVGVSATLPFLNVLNGVENKRVQKAVYNLS